MCHVPLRHQKIAKTFLNLKDWNPVSNSGPLNIKNIILLTLYLTKLLYFLHCREKTVYFCHPDTIFCH